MGHALGKAQPPPKATVMDFNKAVTRLNKPELPDEDTVHKFWERVAGGMDKTLPPTHAGMLMISLGSDGLREDEKNKVLSMNREQLDHAVDVADEDEDFLALSSLLSEIFDIDEDGALSFAEFVSALVVLSDGTFEEKARASFAAIDKDRDGVLKRSDLVTYCKHCLAAMAHSSGRKVRHKAEDEVDKFMAATGVSRDEGVTVEAFLLYVRDHPEAAEIWNLASSIGPKPIVDPRDHDVPRTPLSPMKPNKEPKSQQAVATAADGDADGDADEAESLAGGKAEGGEGCA